MTDACGPVRTHSCERSVAISSRVAIVVCRRVFSLIEIATWFDRLTMSGCAPRNDKVGTKSPVAPVPALRHNAGHRLE